MKEGIIKEQAKERQGQRNDLSNITPNSGEGESKTTYSNLLNISSKASDSFSRRNSEVFAVMDLKAEISKQWQWDSADFIIAVGWETQVWFDQLKINDYSNLENPSSSSKLTLQGPFAKATMQF